MDTKGLIKHILEYTVRSGYEIPCVCILCVNVASYENSFLLSVLFIRMLEVGKQAHKL